jgi:hypothetical protein
MVQMLPQGQNRVRTAVESKASPSVSLNSTAPSVVESIVSVIVVVLSGTSSARIKKQGGKLYIYCRWVTMVHRNFVRQSRCARRLGGPVRRSVSGRRPCQRLKSGATLVSSEVRVVCNSHCENKVAQTKMTSVLLGQGRQRALYHSGRAAPDAHTQCAGGVSHNSPSE